MEFTKHIKKIEDIVSNSLDKAITGITEHKLGILEAVKILGVVGVGYLMIITLQHFFKTKKDNDYSSWR